MSNLTDGKIIKHSHLYPLQPNNIGKARVERFSGYISRLSASHHFIVSTLVTKIIQPLYSSGPSSKKNHSCDLLKNASSSINGTEKWAIDIVDILTELTGSSNLRFTTLQIWGNILPVKGLLRKYQAWCPYCYQELLDSGEIIYEPLISAL